MVAPRCHGGGAFGEKPARVLPAEWRTEMRKVITGAFVSLDGVIQAPGGPKEDSNARLQTGRLGGAVHG
jgi:hypothetical protein